MPVAMPVRCWLKKPRDWVCKMIDTEQTLTIAAPISTVWDFARDIRRWAALMPGMQDCEIIDDDTSRWILKVGVGGLVRTVKVGVRVDCWDGPGRVEFSYKLEGDPVQGGGTYRAEALSADETQISLFVQVQGSGPLAPMWEAMGRPLLPTLARGFAEQFKAEIEKASTPRTSAPTPVPTPSIIGKVQAWLCRVWNRITGKEHAA